MVTAAGAASLIKHCSFNCFSSSYLVDISAHLAVAWGELKRAAVAGGKRFCGRRQRQHHSLVNVSLVSGDAIKLSCDIKSCLIGLMS